MRSLLTALALITLALVSFLGCQSPKTTPIPPPMPPGVGWTNAARLPAGERSSGIAIYLPNGANVALEATLRAVGGVQRSLVIWTIDPILLRNQAHLDALAEVGRAGGTVSQLLP